MAIFTSDDNAAAFFPMRVVASENNVSSCALMDPELQNGRRYLQRMS